MKTNALQLTDVPAVIGGQSVFKAASLQWAPQRAFGICAAAWLVFCVCASDCQGQSYLTEGLSLPPGLEDAGSPLGHNPASSAPSSSPGGYQSSSAGDSSTVETWSREYGPTASPYSATPTRRSFEGINLAVEMPDGPWREMPIPGGATTAGIALLQADPEIVVIIAGEKLGVELGLSSEAILKASRRVAAGIVPGMQFTNERQAAAKGIVGTRYECRGNRQGLPIYGIFWTAQLNGYLYHVMAFGQENQLVAVEVAHQSFLERVAPIDATRVAHADQDSLIQSYESPQFGYRVDLTNLGWLKAESGEDRIPGADFTAERGDLVLMVLPLPLPGRPIDPELLAQVYAERLGLKYPSPEIESAGPCQVGNLQGKKYTAHHPHNGATIDYHLRLLANSQMAYLIVGAAVESDTASMAEVERAMDRVTLTGIPASGAPPANGPAPLDESVEARGLLHNKLGLLLYQRGDLAGALDFFRLAYQSYPSDLAILSNTVDTLQELGRTAEALTLMQQHLVKYRGNLAVEAMQAKLLGATGQSQEARRLYADLFARGHADEGALNDYLTLAKDAKAYDEAIATVRQFALLRPTIDVQLTLATLYSDKGEHDEAIRQLTALVEQNPQNVDVTVALSIVYNDAERFPEAVATTQKLIDAGHREEILWLLHGKHQLNAKQFAEAKRTFEQVAERFPHSEVAKELLRAAASQMGQGNNTALTTPIAPVDIPPAVRAAIARAPVQAAKSLEKYGAEEQVRIVGVSYRKNQPRRMTVSRRIKVHTAGGVSQYSTLEFDLNPNVERFFVNRLVVLDAAGKQVAEGSVDSYYVLDDSSSGMATDAKTVTVPVPGLKAGYTIECMVTREDRAPSETFGFDEVVLASSVPVGVSAYYVAGDVQGLKHKTSLSLRVETAADLILCVTANPTPYRDEAKQQSRERFLPMVWIGESNSSWELESKEYLKMIADRLELDEGTKKLSAELTRECKSNREKLAVLAAYSQNACTYHAIEFGRRARVPNTAAETLSLKYGDCKDHAMLLKQLLAGVGIASHLTVVNSSKPLTAELPSLDQFDHMVLYVPGDAVGQPANSIGGLIVDATNKNADPLLFPPHGLADKSFLVLDPAQPRVVHTPVCPLDAQQLLCQRRVIVRADASQSSAVEVDVQERLTFNSYIAPGMRSYLRSFESGERREALQNVLAANQNVRLKRADIEHLDDLAQPLVVYLEYSLPDAMHAVSSAASGNTLIGRVPAAWETYFLEAEYLDSRETPFEIAVPKLVRSNIEILLPAGYHLADMQRLTNTGRTSFAAWASQVKQDGTRIQLDHVVRVPAGRFAAADYGAYYAGMKKSLAALQTPLTLQGSGAMVAAGATETLLR